jgi:predicted helicase
MKILAIESSCDETSAAVVEKNGDGIVVLITAHGYIDNPTFRGMRWHLRNTFDKIYVVDLHGNSNKKETSPDGSKDENVFDIKTGVSIIFGVKSSKNTKDKKLATVYKTDIYGVRKDKFSFIENANISNIQWIELPDETDLWVLEGAGKSEYQKGFSVAEIFPKNTTGIVTGIDRLSIFETKEGLEKTTQSILSSSDPYTEFGIKDGRRTKKEDRLKELREAVEKNTMTPISYRPFDIRWMYYTAGSEVWINSPRPDVMQHFVNRENVGLVFVRKSPENNPVSYIFISNNIIPNGCIRSDSVSIDSLAPLYLYTDQNEKIPNLNKEIWTKIDEVVGRGGEQSEPPTTPENILDYIYAVLHSPSYREKYKEFLKIDFPRVLYPESREQFLKLAEIGERLRGLHLMTDTSVNDFITIFPNSGNDEVEKVTYKDSKVYINTDQYFGNVPEVAWNFYIGGYQPAQKYLKDRKGRKLSNDEIEHYQRIIKVLVETDRIMKQIDIIGVF